VFTPTHFPPRPFYFLAVDFSKSIKNREQKMQNKNKKKRRHTFGRGRLRALLDSVAKAFQI
jgi:hypothetical protein